MPKEMTKAEAEEAIKRFEYDWGKREMDTALERYRYAQGHASRDAEVAELVEVLKANEDCFQTDGSANRCIICQKRRDKLIAKHRGKA